MKGRRMGIIPFRPVSAAAACASSSAALASAFRMRVPSPRARITALVVVVLTRRRSVAGVRSSELACCVTRNATRGTGTAQPAACRRGVEVAGSHRHRHIPVACPKLSSRESAATEGSARAGPSLRSGRQPPSARRDAMTKQPVRLSVEPDATATDIAVVTAGLRAFNVARIGEPADEPVRIFLRDERGKVVGGLLGHIRWRWLYVARLWIDDAHRGAGHGAALMASAEAHAQSRGCLGSYLDTFEYQPAPSNH